MAKREYIQANKDWLEAKAKEEGDTQCKKYCDGSLHREDNQRQNVRQQPWRCSVSLQAL